MAIPVIPNKVPTFSGGWGDFFLPEYPYLFRYLIDEYASFFGLISYTKKNNPNVKTVAILNPDTDSGRGPEKAAVMAWKGLGVQVVDSMFYEPGTIDFLPAVTKLLSKKPDFFDPCNTLPGDYPLVYKAARDLGYTGDLIGGSIPEQPLEGTISFGVVADDPKETPLQREYRKAYLARHGELHSWWEFIANGVHPFFTNFLPNAKSADPSVVYKTITAPGYRFETFWGPSYWWGKEVAIWRIDRQLASAVPIKKAIGGKWVQTDYLQPKEYLDLYRLIKPKE